MAGTAGARADPGSDAQDEVDRFQRQVEEALEGAGGDRDVAAKVREAVADAARCQGVAGLPSAIQAASKSLASIISEHKGGQGATTPSTGSVLSNIASTIAQAAVGGGEIQHLVEEEEAAYSAQSAVLPLRELASDPNPRAHPGPGAKPGAELPGGATELMGGHTKPPQVAAGFAGAAEQRARSAREAQQAALEEQTGDTLYRSAGREESEEAPPGDTSFASDMDKRDASKYT
ncbi:hypothetical protein WJX81_002253 [Elliptochloris bilobata]|uniref:SMP domain-containing protein n=1 Tax=Elliptochloris bilobata TaxID=381761 RepID=A0AAW1QKC0_9CHLO